MEFLSRGTSPTHPEYSPPHSSHPIPEYNPTIPPPSIPSARPPFRRLRSPSPPERHVPHPHLANQSPPIQPQSTRPRLITPTAPHPTPPTRPTPTPLMSLTIPPRSSYSSPLPGPVRPTPLPRGLRSTNKRCPTCAALMRSEHIREHVLQQHLHPVFSTNPAERNNIPTTDACSLRMRWWSILVLCTGQANTLRNRQRIVGKALALIPSKTKVSPYAMAEVVEYSTSKGRTPPSDATLVDWTSGQELMWQVAAAALSLFPEAVHEETSRCFRDTVEREFPPHHPTHPTTSATGLTPRGTDTPLPTPPPTPSTSAATPYRPAPLAPPPPPETPDPTPRRKISFKEYQERRAAAKKKEEDK